MPLSNKQKNTFLEKELDSMKVDKKHWDEILQVNRKKLLKVFLAGATVASLIWLFIFYIYIKTGFQPVW